MRTARSAIRPTPPFLCWWGPGLRCGEAHATSRGGGPAARTGRRWAPVPDGGVPGGASARAAAHVGAVLGGAGTGAGARARAGRRARGTRAGAAGARARRWCGGRGVGRRGVRRRARPACSPSCPLSWTWWPHRRPTRRRRGGRRSVRRWPGRCEGGSAWLSAFRLLKRRPIRAGTPHGAPRIWVQPQRDMGGCEELSDERMTIHSNGGGAAPQSRCAACRGGEARAQARHGRLSAVAQRLVARQQ